MGLYVALYIKGRFTTFTSSDLREAGIDSAMERAVTFCRAMKSDPAVQLLIRPSTVTGRMAT
jgi:hypothetical protein